MYWARSGIKDREDQSSLVVRIHMESRNVYQPPEFVAGSHGDECDSLCWDFHSLLGEDEAELACRNRETLLLTQLSLRLVAWIIGLAGRGNKNFWTNPQTIRRAVNPLNGVTA